MPLPSVSETDWRELLGSQPSYLSVVPTNPNNSDVSAADTIQLMQQYAQEDSQSTQIQEAADEIRDAATGDSARELIDATFEWIKSHIQFVEDEQILKRLFGIDSGTELLIKPSRLLSMNNPMGDCDDFSMLTKSILINLGVDTSLVTVAANKSAIGRWSHVYNMAHLEDGSLLPIDSSHGKYVGWEAPGVSRKGMWKDKEGGENMNVKTNNVLGDIDWEAILTPISQVGGSILKAQYGQPQLAPGTYIRGADGSILTNQPVTTAGILPAGAGSVGSSLSSILPIILVGGLMLLVLGGRR